MWNPSGGKVGSLVLGNRAEDMGKFKKGVTPWQIRIDKVTRFKEEMREAEDLYDKSELTNYAEMRDAAEAKRKSAENEDATRPLDTQLGLTNEHLAMLKSS